MVGFRGSFVDRAGQMCINAKLGQKTSPSYVRMVRQRVPHGTGRKAADLNQRCWDCRRLRHADRRQSAPNGSFRVGTAKRWLGKLAKEKNVHRAQAFCFQLRSATKMSARIRINREAPRFERRLRCELSRVAVSTRSIDQNQKPATPPLIPTK